MHSATLRIIKETEGKGMKVRKLVLFFIGCVCAGINLHTARKERKKIKGITEKKVRNDNCMRYKNCVTFNLQTAIIEEHRIQ